MRVRKFLLLSPLLVAAALLLYVRVSREVPLTPLDPALPVPAIDTRSILDLEEEPAGALHAAGADPRSVAAAPSADEPVGEPPRLAFVTVVDGKNEDPVHGASVRWNQGDVTGESSTDESGVAPLDLDLLGSAVVLHVESEGFFPFERSLGLSRQYRVELQRPSTRLRGRVLEVDTGIPIPAARILAEAVGVEARAESDSRGWYQFEGLPDDVDLRFDVIAEGFPAQTTRFRLRPGAVERTRDFVLEHGHRFQGRVIDEDTSTGIAGATMTSSWIRDEVRVTGADGSFDVEYLPNSTGFGDGILIEAQGYCSLTVHMPRESHTDVSLPLVRPAWIEGVVRAGASPVEGAEIRYAVHRGARVTSREGWPEPQLLGNTSRGKSWHAPSVPIGPTDPQGRFRGELVPLGPHTRPELHIRARAIGFLEATMAVELPASGVVQHVEFDLEPEPRTATVHGIALLNGEPLAGLLAWKAGSMRRTEEVRNGVFRIEGLPPGPIVLTLRPLGLSPAPAEHVSGLRRELDLEAGSDVRVDFDLASEVGEIRGHVVTNTGTPLAGKQVRARLGRRGVMAETGPRGEYRFELPDLGEPYTLFCIRAQVEEVEDVELGSTVDFVLPVFAEVRVRAEDASTARPITGFSVSSQPAGEDSGPTMAFLRGPDTDGWSEASLPVGKIDLHARAPGYVSTTVADLEVSPSTSTPDLVLNLRRWSSVSLELEEDCLPLPADHHVFLVEDHLWRDLRFEPFPGGALPTIDGRDLDLARRRTVRFDAKRTAHLQGVGEGVLRFKTIPNDIVIEPAVVVLPLAEPGPVPVRWSWRSP